MSDLAKIKEIVDAYNQIFAGYLSHVNAQTKGVILSSLRRALPYVNEITRGLHSVAGKYVAFAPGNRHLMQYVKDYLHSVVVAFTAYDLIDEQLRSGNIQYLITSFKTI